MSDDEAQYAIERQEFPAEMRTAAKYVAIIPTQSWCHQWHAMRVWMRSPSAGGKDVTVFYYEYDTTDLFDPFREAKERYWDNDQIPYIRYYREGALVHESNFCSEDEFYRAFDA